MREGRKEVSFSQAEKGRGGNLQGEGRKKKKKGGVLKKIWGRGKAKKGGGG